MNFAPIWRLGRSPRSRFSLQIHGGWFIIAGIQPADTQVQHTTVTCDGRPGRPTRKSPAVNCHGFFTILGKKYRRRIIFFEQYLAGSLCLFCCIDQIALQLCISFLRFIAAFIQFLLKLRNSQFECFSQFASFSGSCLGVSIRCKSLCG